MEVEKRKILGTYTPPQNETKKNADLTVPLEENTVGDNSEKPEVNTESIENDPEYEEQPFYKEHLGAVLCCSLVGIIGLYFLFTKVVHPSGDITEETNETSLASNFDSEDIALKGTVNRTIGFTMHLHFYGKDVEGNEHYDSQRKDVTLAIKGSNSDNGTLVLYEYDGNSKAGTFEGAIKDNVYSGSFTNSKGNTFPFTARVLTESALSKIKEETRFETTNFVYKNNTSKANVELSVDYPTKGTDALLKRTRKYISGVIAKLFSVKEFGGNLEDGSAVIRWYGKAKYDDLDREWEESEYEGAPAYEETITFTKDFENEYGVSLCANSFYFHGGVGNMFCDAATFRKADGKVISILKSTQNAGLQELIISAMKKELGSDYEVLNEEFESSPVAGIIHYVENGVQFDYQHYEIGPGNLGQISITIPYERILPYMSEDAKNILDSPSFEEPVAM